MVSAGGGDAALYQEYLSVALKAANTAGALIKEAWGSGDKDIHFKGDVDLVTQTDKNCESVVKAAIHKAYPGHRFIGEEETASAGGHAHLTDEPTWMVDPLDGTTNFVHGYPFSCVSVALAINKRPVVGVVFNPILGELYTAARGCGAFLNGSPISVSGTADISQALFATEIGTTRDPETIDAMYDRLRALTAVARSVRCCGSCAMNLCGVARGRLDAFYEINFGGCWDVAAGALIVEEAGGVVVDPSGGAFDVMARRVLASNAHVGPAFAAVLGGCKVSAAEAPPTAPTAAGALA